MCAYPFCLLDSTPHVLRAFLALYVCIGGRRNTSKKGVVQHTESWSKNTPEMSDPPPDAGRPRPGQEGANQQSCNRICLQDARHWALSFLRGRDRRTPIQPARSDRRCTNQHGSACVHVRTHLRKETIEKHMGRMTWKRGRRGDREGEGKRKGWGRGHTA